MIAKFLHKTYLLCTHVLAAEKTGSLLNIFIKNKNRRLAKDICLNFVEFIFAIITLILSIYDYVPPCGQTIKTNAIILPLGGVVIAYAIFLILVVSIHAFVNEPRELNKEIEQRYQQLGKIPYLDVLRELPMSFTLGSNKCLVVFLWCSFVFVVVAVSVAISTSNYITKDTYSAAILGIIQLYRINGSVAEYFVRNNKDNSIFKDSGISPTNTGKALLY